MELYIQKSTPAQLHDLRMLFLWESHFQFTYNKCHQYGWSDIWEFQIDGKQAGYGAVWGRNKREDRDTIFEFFLLQPYREFSSPVFRQFIATTGAGFIDAQSNDHQLNALLQAFGQNIVAEAYLFEDTPGDGIAGPAADQPGVLFKKDPDEEDNATHAAGFYLERDGDKVATGGFLMNYNFPYADIYMEVKKPYRRQGFGVSIVRELKSLIYLRGLVPACRCNTDNIASRATLQKAGFRICGQRLTGEINFSK